MSQDTIEDVASQNDTVQDTDQTQDDVIDQSALADESNDSIDELKEKLEKQRQQNLKLFKRTKKAEGFEEKPDGSWKKKTPVDAVVSKPKPESNEMSSMDLYALVKADVPSEDVSEIKEYARYKGISIAEALKDNVVKTILSEKAEQRKTADATNTGPTRRGNSKASADTLLAKAQKTGEIPDGEDLDRMLEARYSSNTK